MNDLDDIEDRLMVLEGTVEELKEGGISRSQLEIVLSNQTLSQYIALEDGILSGFEALSENSSPEYKDKLVVLIDKYNKLGCEFQDTWDEIYWEMYENIREGYINVIKMQRASSAVRVSLTVKESQELALSLKCEKRKSNLEYTGQTKMKEVDEIAKLFQSTTIEIQPEKNEEELPKKKCRNCEILQEKLNLLKFWDINYLLVIVTQLCIKFMLLLYN